MLGCKAHQLPLKPNPSGLGAVTIRCVVIDGQLGVAIVLRNIHDDNAALRERGRQKWRTANACRNNSCRTHMASALVSFCLPDHLQPRGYLHLPACVSWLRLGAAPPGRRPPRTIADAP